jgi:Galactose oxidase, central domain
MSSNHQSSKSWALLVVVALVVLSAVRALAAGLPSVLPPTSPVLVGASFTLNGSGFTPGAKVNFYVSTAAGSVNQGPLTPAAVSPNSLSVNVPADLPLGEGVVALQVVDTDAGFAGSNVVMAFLQGAAGAGIPSLTAINGTALAASSIDPAYAIDNVETVVAQGSQVTLQGDGFDTVNGVAVDVFCACAGGKVGPFLLNPGNPGLSANSLTLTLPATGANALPVGPASFVISNKGADGSYSEKSNAVSVPVGRRIQVVSALQQGGEVVVDGTGFSTLTVINFYATKGASMVNLGGLNVSGGPAIAITLVSATELRFAIPAGALPGAAYVQALNPPFVPFAVSGYAALTLASPAASPTASAHATPTAVATPIASASPSASPSAKSTTAPSASATATPAANGGVLMTGGIGNTAGVSALASTETYNEAAGSFSATAPMGYARQGHTTTVLGNGTILVAGGHNSYSMRSMPSAELYNIQTGTFSFTGSMNAARLGHSAVLLNNGKVLVAGGQNPDFSAQDLAEIYDPASGQFTPTASMQDARVGHTATVLGNGKVLIAGGADNDGPLSSAEVYDANGAGSVAVGAMNTARQNATATLLGNGTVLIAGGAVNSGSCSGCATASAEIYNPATATFTPTASMHSARRGHSATLLANGQVLIAGGLNDASAAVLTSAEIYDPATATFTVIGNMNCARFEHTASLLPSGKVLLAGGLQSSSSATNSAELYDPSTGHFTLTGSLTAVRAEQGVGSFN